MSKITLKISKPILYSIIILLVTVAIVFAVIESSRITNEYWWKKHTRELAEERLNGEVERIQNIILSIEQIPQNLAYVLEFSKIRKEQIRFLLNAVVENNDEVFGTCIAFEPNSYEKDSTFYAPYLYRKNGNLVYTDPTDSSDYYFSSDWYLIPRTLNQPVWIEPYFDAGSSGGNIVMATYSVPFYSFDGKKETIHGIIAVDISIDWLAKLVSSIKLFDEGYGILVSANGTVLSAPNPEWIYNESLFSLADENNVPLLRDIGRDLQQGKSGFINVGKFGTRRDWWIYYRPIPANKWGILLVVPEG
ncbi:MAG: cache domain-containing protein [Ignavibacteriales bacterium]|nr:cache domain-containing protein [Ignavibacteriales bacterium]